MNEEFRGMARKRIERRDQNQNPASEVWARKSQALIGSRLVSLRRTRKMRLITNLGNDVLEPEREVFNDAARVNWRCRAVNNKSQSLESAAYYALLILNPATVMASRGDWEGSLVTFGLLAVSAWLRHLARNDRMQILKTPIIAGKPLLVDYVRECAVTLFYN